MIATEFTVRLISHSLAELAERVERMPEADFLDEHAAIHAETGSPTVNIVAAVLEQEFQRRWPEGRDDDEVRKCPAA